MYIKLNENIFSSSLIEQQLRLDDCMEAQPPVVRPEQPQLQEECVEEAQPPVEGPEQAHTLEDRPGEAQSIRTE